MPEKPDPFPASEFDEWAATYDETVLENRPFPFDGYQQVLETILHHAQPQPGQAILDVGTGTGNLALLFAQKGCQVTGLDFSAAMLEKARQKLPNATFFLHDLRQPLPQAWHPPFDYIVSAYVFHHFELEQKIHLCKQLIQGHLAPKGRLLIGDISFPNRIAQEKFKQGIPTWEEEFYWLADEALASFQNAGLQADYTQISPCAGVYQLHAR